MAISSGDGRTIEARNSRDGVGVFTASTQRFNYAAVIPGLSGVPSGGYGGYPGLVPDTAPGPVVDPFDLPGAALPSAVLSGPGQTDSDGDGLTDRFEALLHTDPNRADTDADGLSDTFETATLHSDPLRADTDGDGVVDSVEVARGDDAGRAAVPQEAVDAGFGGSRALDTDRDGLTDDFERGAGTLGAAALPLTSGPPSGAGFDAATWGGPELH